MFSAKALNCAAKLVELACHQKRRISSIESCTGGLITGCITAIPGSSAVLERAIVTYSNDAKSDFVAVLPFTLKSFGAVSRSTVLQMAQGGVIACDADLVLAASGIAGPDGGTPTKPVGLVHLAACSKQGQCLHAAPIFDGDRHDVRMRSVEMALEMGFRLLSSEH